MYLCFFCNSFVYFPNYNRWQLVFLNAIFSCFFFLFFHKCIQFYFWLWYAALNLTSLFCLYVKIFRSDEIDIYTVHRYLYIDRCISVSIYTYTHTHTRAHSLIIAENQALITRHDLPEEIWFETKVAWVVRSRWLEPSKQDRCARRDPGMAENMTFNGGGFNIAFDYSLSAELKPHLWVVSLS